MAELPVLLDLIPCPKDIGGTGIALTRFGAYPPTGFRVDSVQPLRTRGKRYCRWLVTYTRIDKPDNEPIQGKSAANTFKEHVFRLKPGNTEILGQASCSTGQDHEAWLITYGVGCNCSKPVYGKIIVKNIEKSLTKIKIEDP